jgi:DNA repair protein RecN (Recombination protein N)
VLRELHISGLGVIADLDLDLHPGLNVLTGETGAGKTLVAVGLALATGGRGSASLVREGAKAARVQARFDAPPDADEWAEDGEVVLARSIGAEGKSGARIGGQLATVSALATLGPSLLEIHGQHGGMRLLEPATQTAFLDRFAGGAHVVAVAEYRETHVRLHSARKVADELAAASRDRERELDLLSYQVREIEGVGPRPGETDELTADEARLGHVERLLELFSNVDGSLGSDGGGADAIAAAAAGLEQASVLDQGASPLAERARGLAAEVSELARDAREYEDRLGPDPVRLEAVRERLRSLKALHRKYGETDAEVLGFLADASARLKALEGGDQYLAEAREEVAGFEVIVAERAADVTAGRLEAAPRLARALTSELRALGMPEAAVDVAIEPLGDPGPMGSERVEIRFAPGLGQPVLAVAAAASGGELSRAMLACRSVLADLDEVPTLVFDEVDAGIGGEAGLAVGHRLARLAVDRQVLVVTHLPQIACFADLHVRVRKEGGAAEVQPLDDEGRVRELSRMLAGLQGSEHAVSHAEELLAEAANVRGARASAAGGPRSSRVSVKS